MHLLPFTSSSSVSTTGAFVAVSRCCFRRRIHLQKVSASSSAPSQKPLRYAVLGAGFAGLSVTWHLLQHSPKESSICIDIYDEVGIAGGASGVSGGLLHPYSPKVKPLWRSMECWKESLKLISVAEAAVESNKLNLGSQELVHDFDEFIVRRRGYNKKELNLHKKAVISLLELQDYDSVIICLGARATFLPELSERLPLRTCRGVIAHLQLPDDIRESYPKHGPSILSDAWLAIHGPRDIRLGSTWEWKSRNYSQNVPAEEASKALNELLPKASAIYPGIENWEYTASVAGLRAMPPLTYHGSLPLLGCIDEFLIGKQMGKFWLFTGLGSRGLLYHGWLGKLMAQAVVCCNEDVIPSELVAWKSKMK